MAADRGAPGGRERKARAKKRGAVDGSSRILERKILFSEGNSPVENGNPSSSPLLDPHCTIQVTIQHFR
jgi:hypothetical protein